MQVFSAAESAELARLARDGKENGDFTRAFANIWGQSGGRYGMGSTDNPYDQFGRLALLRQVPKVTDQYKTTPELEAPDPAFVTFRSEDYRAMYKYLWRIIQDDKGGLYKQIASSLGQAMGYTKELLGHEVFNRATDVTFTSGWDGQPLVSASHKLLGGGTYSNVIAPTPVSEALYDAVYAYFDQVPDEHGRPMKINKFYAVASTRKVRAHRQLMGAATALVSVPGVTLNSGTVNPNENIPNRWSEDFGRTQLSDTPYFSDPNTFVVLGQGHELIWRDRLSAQTMVQFEDPPAEAQRIWYSGYRGWLDARRILVISAS